MSQSYKVPQDVEAEDKLIGPFSFRQFIYLGIVAMAIAAGWGLFLLFKPLAVIPLPIVVFFGALALPLRKDQPMETYLAAMWQFYIKPRRRMWMADGVISRISIDIPVVVERQLTKNLTSAQAISQFDYLSQIADSGGWSSRGVAHAPLAVVDNPADDILDDSSSVAQSFDTRLQREDDQRREDLLARVHSGAIAEAVTVAPPAPSPAQYTIPAVPAPQPAQPAAPSYQTPIGAPVPDLYGSDAPLTAAPTYDPTPAYMQQHVIQPLGLGQTAHQPYSHIPQPTQAIQPEPIPQPVVAEKPAETGATQAEIDAIMELAKGVSVETVAKQLHHEEVERHADGEVVINLH